MRVTNDSLGLAVRDVLSVVVLVVTSAP